MCGGQSSLSCCTCGTLICLLSVCNSFKPRIVSVDHRKGFKSIEDMLRYHKVSFDILNTLITRQYRFFKVCYTTRPQWSPNKKIKTYYYIINLLSACGPVQFDHPIVRVQVKHLRQQSIQCQALISKGPTTLIVTLYFSH